MTSNLSYGDLVWVDLDPTQGKEQAGRRPALVIASDDYLEIVDDLAIVLPITSVDRGWDNHVAVPAGTFKQPSFIMTEQPRTIARHRIKKRIGQADTGTLRAVNEWLGYFVGA